MSDPWSELGGRRPVKAAPKAPAPAKPSCGRPVCRHGDDHVCPWLDELDPQGRAQLCGCKPESPAT